MTHRQPLKNSELRAQEQFFQLSGKNKTLGTPCNVNGVGYRGYIFEKSRFNAENSYDPYVNTCFEVVNALSELERGCSYNLERASLVSRSVIYKSIHKTDL